MALFADNFFDESVLGWREPNAYVRMKLSRGRWVGLAALFLMPAFALVASGHAHGFSQRRIIEILAVAGLATAGFFLVLSSPGAKVCLKQDGIVTSGSRHVNRIRYARIESCRVCPGNYKGENFWILRFTFKKGTFLNRNRIAVPKDVDLNQVLEIFRGHGVKIINE